LPHIANLEGKNHIEDKCLGERMILKYTSK